MSICICIYLYINKTKKNLSRSSIIRNNHCNYSSGSHREMASHTGLYVVIYYSFEEIYRLTLGIQASHVFVFIPGAIISRSFLWDFELRSSSDTFTKISCEVRRGNLEHKSKHSSHSVSMQFPLLTLPSASPQGPESQQSLLCNLPQKWIPRFFSSIWPAIGALLCGANWNR